MYSSPLPQNTGDAAHNSSLGPIIGAIIILIVVTIGAFYFWGGVIQQSSKEKSDDLAAIASDLTATDSIYSDLNIDAIGN